MCSLSHLCRACGKYNFCDEKAEEEHVKELEALCELYCFEKSTLEEVCNNLLREDVQV